MLRTTMLVRHDGELVLCHGIDEACGPDALSGDPDLLHDAAYAHALIRSVDEWADLPVAEMINHDANDWIKSRAADLMRESGFEEKVTP